MIFTNNCPKYEVDHMAVGPKMQPTCPKFVGSRRRQWQPTPVYLPGKSHGSRSLVGYSPRGHKGQTGLSDFTVTFTFMLFSPEVANFLLVGLGSVKQVQKFKERGGKRGPCLPLTLQSPKEMN